MGPPSAGFFFLYCRLLCVVPVVRCSASLLVESHKLIHTQIRVFRFLLFRFFSLHFYRFATDLSERPAALHRHVPCKVRGGKPRRSCNDERSSVGMNLKFADSIEPGINKQDLWKPSLPLFFFVASNLINLINQKGQNIVCCIQLPY